MIEDAECGRETTVDEKEFFILPSDLFVTVRRRARRDQDLKGLFDDMNVNSAKRGNSVIKCNENLA